MSGPGAVEQADFGPPFDLVLASTSRYRRVLLERLGIPFRCRPPICDESVASAKQPNPVHLAETLAHAKAASLAVEEAGAAIIGCDQVVAFRDRILGKPGTFERAVDQLGCLSGQAHSLITAVVVLQGARAFRHTDVTILQMRSLSRAAIERYVMADHPLDCAGSYKIESRGIVLFERIESRDQTAITGLPLIALVSILREIGFQIP
jgi:7-methyl-GTP pyrophosphatase